ncbi:MAG: RNA polymerase sigma factor [Clostridia bacterium]|nr:RNA polymerase sigma factor [Clostridia bacterium]
MANSKLDLNYIAGLVPQIQAGDSNAFAELFAATYQSQYAFACGYLKDTEVAKEALQETYVSALKNIGKLRNPSLVMAWLNQTTLRTCFNIESRNAAYVRKTDGQAVTDPESKTVTIGTEQYVVRMIMQLPFTESQVLLLRYLCGMKPAEVASLMGITKADVRRHTTAATERLNGFRNTGVSRK